MDLFLSSAQLSFEKEIVTIVHVAASFTLQVWFATRVAEITQPRFINVYYQYITSLGINVVTQPVWLKILPTLRR